MPHVRKSRIFNVQNAASAAVFSSLFFLPLLSEATVPVHDYASYLQTAFHYLYQFRMVIQSTQEHLSAFKSAYDGVRDWRTLDWKATLDIANLPWFDGVEGIDGIREVTALAVVNVEEAQKLWSAAESLGSLQNSQRYRSDAWYRAKVDSVLRQSKRARRTRMALMRQMVAQNRQLTEDVQRIDRLREQLRLANSERPVNQGKISTLQAELSAIEAKYQGQNLLLTNQRAMLFLVGEERAHSDYADELQKAWLWDNNEALRKWGRGFAK